MAYSQGCPECGYIHPPVPPGTCPVANQKNMEAVVRAESSTYIANTACEVQKQFMTKIKLITSEPLMQKFSEEVLNFIRNYKV